MSLLYHLFKSFSIFFDLHFTCLTKINLNRTLRCSIFVYLSKSQIGGLKARYELWGSRRLCMASPLDAFLQLDSIRHVCVNSILQQVANFIHAMRDYIQCYALIGKTSVAELKECLQAPVLQSKKIKARLKFQPCFFVSFNSAIL